MPEGVFNPAIHLYDQRTLYDELDDAGVGWQIYYGDFAQSLLLTHQLGKLSHYRKLDRFASDAQAGDLPAYVFIVIIKATMVIIEQRLACSVLNTDAISASPRMMSCGGC
jgi:hypothetical protein